MMTRRDIAARLRSDGSTLQEIGDALGVSRERARQLLLPPIPRIRLCKGCGQPLELPRIQYHPACRPKPVPKPVPKPRALGVKSSPGRRRADLRGRTFGFWTVLDAPVVRAGRHLLWSCRCRCGTEARVPADKLLAGGSTRCRPCSLAKTWEKACRTCGRQYFGTCRQVYCVPACRPKPAPTTENPNP